MKHLLVLIVLFSALADDANARFFEQYLIHNKAYTSAVNKKFNTIFTHTYPDCKKTPKIIRLKPEIISPAHFSQNNKEKELSELSKANPEYGQWVEKAKLNGCGKQTNINLLSVAHFPEQSPLLYPLLNGQTKIPPIYQARAEEIVFNTIQDSNNCPTSSIVTNTHFLGYRSKENKSIAKDNQNLGWFERWSVEACDSETLVNLVVLPDPRTQYRYIAKIIPK